MEETFGRRNVAVFYYRWHHKLASVTFSIPKVIHVIVTLFFFHFVACFRFSLLLLEPAEIYFEDFSAFLFPLDADEHDFEKKKQIGRLKMCSKSIVFDPKDINKPLIKIPLKECISISEWDGELASRYSIFIYVELLPLCCIYWHIFVNFCSKFMYIRRVGEMWALCFPDNGSDIWGGRFFLLNLTWRHAWPRFVLVSLNFYMPLPV